MLHGPGWWFFGMHVLWWAFWIALIVTLFATVTPVPKNQAKAGERALDILRRRYAAGQLTTAEYEERKAVLERDEPGEADRSSGRPTHAHH